MKVDMSPQAVRGRLELVGQLWRLGVALGKAKRESDARRSENKNASDTAEKITAPNQKN